MQRGISTSKAGRPSGSLLYIFVFMFLLIWVGYLPFFGARCESALAETFLVSGLAILLFNSLLATFATEALVFLFAAINVVVYCFD